MRRRRKFIPVMRQVYGQGDPYAAIFDALAFSKQCEEYFTTGIGRDRFGAYQGIAIEAMRENTRRLHDATSRALRASIHDTLIVRTEDWVARHPLTNHLFERSSVLLELQGVLEEQGNSIGSAVGAWAGFHHLVIKGKAEKPVYLWINNGKIEIRDARNLWGKTTTETQWAIREELGDEDIKSLVIVRQEKIWSGLQTL